MSHRRIRTPMRHRPVVEQVESRLLLAFGLTTTSTSYNVDTGAGVTFSVLRGGSLSSTIHLGDLTSFKLNGVEFSAPYSATSRYSHFESGLSSGTVMSATVDPSPTPQWIKISCDDTTATVGAGATGVIMYYMARRNDPVIYMATYAPEMLVSSTRFITYLDWNKFPNHPDESDTSGSTGAIESSDVFGFADGTTASKYYGETRNIDHVYHGATGPAAGAFMFIGNRERGSGGPFWKDIDFQSTGASVELYNIPYSAHSQTENFRPGLHGPFALVLTNGSQPAVTPDYSFIDSVGLTGWVSPAARGSLSGSVAGIAPGKAPTVGLSNADAQYWCTPNASGDYAIPGIIPGTYTETLYEEELAVGTRTVTITAAHETRADIVATSYLALNPANGALTPFPAVANPIFRIGTWDGTPREFLNGDKITLMHPSDSRLSPWAADSTGVTNFTIGVDPDSAWPMAEWHSQVGAAPYVDLRNRITFNLTAAQAATPMTLRIGITRLDHGRPNISVNGGSSPTAQNQTTQPATRGVSLGSWRGNNSLYSFNISTSSLHAGTNTIDIWCVSGSAGAGYYSGYHIYDAIDLIPTSSASVPAVASIVVTPANPSVVTGAAREFTAQAFSQNGTPIPANFTWTSTRGIVDDTGAYIAPATTGTDTVRASSGNISGTANITVIPPLATTGGSFLYETKQAISISFNRDVDPAMLLAALVLQNTTTSTTIPAGSIQLNYNNPAAEFTFDSVLANGNYRATIPASAQLTSAGDRLASDYTLDFFVLAGDANRDRVVDISDLAILATNWQLSPRTFSQGDCNYDGMVDISDLAILATNWQVSIPLAAGARLADATSRTMRSRVADGILR